MAFVFGPLPVVLVSVLPVDPLLPDCSVEAVLMPEEESPLAVPASAAEMASASLTEPYEPKEVAPEVPLDLEEDPLSLSLLPRPEDEDATAGALAPASVPSSGDFVAPTVPTAPPEPVR